MEGISRLHNYYNMGLEWRHSGTNPVLRSNKAKFPPRALMFFNNCAFSTEQESSDSLLSDMILNKRFAYIPSVYKL